jgi:hypothetical protein
MLIYGIWGVAAGVAMLSQAAKNSVPKGVAKNTRCHVARNFSNYARVLLPCSAFVRLTHTHTFASLTAFGGDTTANRTNVVDYDWLTL